MKQGRGVIGVSVCFDGIGCEIECAIGKICVPTECVCGYLFICVWIEKFLPEFLQFMIQSKRVSIQLDGVEPTSTMFECLFSFDPTVLKDTMTQEVPSEESLT
jgi:hypothetical protein